MAGPVRQKIDQASLERYLEKNVPEVKPPLELKQVSVYACKFNGNLSDEVCSSASANPTQPTRSPIRPKPASFSVKSLQVNFFPKPRIRSTANIESYTH